MVLGFVFGPESVISPAKSEHYYGKQGHFDALLHPFTHQGPVRSSVYLVNVHR